MSKEDNNIKPQEQPIDEPLTVAGKPTTAAEKPAKESAGKTAKSEGATDTKEKVGKEQQEKADKEPKQPKEKSAPTLSEVLRDQVKEEEAPVSKGMTMRKILGGDLLDTTAVRSQLWLLVIITVFIVVSISLRYNCQKSLIEIDRLHQELQDAKYKALSTNSRLTEQTRESRVLESLAGNKDSVLHIAKQPPYIVNVPQDNEK